MQNESQYSVEEGNADDVIISSRDIDSNYEPSIEEIKQYGAFLGMNADEDANFFYIAKKGLKAPIPTPWKACQRRDGQIYYFNFETGESQWEHPYDEEFRKEFQTAKRIALSKDQKNENIVNYADFSQEEIIGVIDENNHSRVLENLEKRKAEEMLKIENELEAELKRYEKELTLKYEQKVSELRGIGQKHNESEIETGISDEMNEKIEIEQEFQFDQEELNKNLEQESRALQKQSAEILNDEIKRIQRDYDLLINAEMIKLRSTEILLQSGRSERKLRTELPEEYNKMLSELEIEYRNRFERETIEFKLQKAKEFSEKTQVLSSNSKDLKREYDNILEQEKNRLRLKRQKLIENLSPEQSHSVFLMDMEKSLRAEFDAKVKRIESEKIQHARELSNSLDAKHRQLQRIYELEKLSLQNSSNEILQVSQREVKNIEKDLKMKEGFIKTCNVQKEQAQEVEKDIIQKDTLLCELVIKIKEVEMSIQEQNIQIQQYQSRLEANRSPNNNKVFLLQKIGEMHERLDTIQNELKASEKAKQRTQNAVSNSQGMAKDNISRLLRDLKGIKTSIIQKNKRNSFTAGQKPANDYVSVAGNTDTFLLTNTECSQIDLFGGRGISSDKEKRSISTDNRYKAGRSSVNNYTSVGYTSIANETRKSFEKDLSYISTIPNEKLARKIEEQPRHWSVLNDSSTLGLRDQNIQRNRSTKKESNLYGRSSLQNDTEINYKPGYPKDIFYAKKSQWGISSGSKPLDKQELIGSVQLRNKYKNDRIFSQYDSLIKKYSSK